jgi:hypothetical protein
MTTLEGKLRITSQLVATAAATLAAIVATPAAADSCSNLATSYHRSNTTITTAETVPAGTFVTPTVPPQLITGLPQFCRVAGFTTPTNDSHIDFEVWMPEVGWNLKYLQVGCGGFCGFIEYSSMGRALRRGYASAATDDGHQAGKTTTSWAVGHPERLIDFGYRAVKETTDIAKDIILAFNMNGPRRSYFMGCSDGGREALMSAQRNPRDFDGILAGSPENNATGQFTGWLWNERALIATVDGDLAQADLNTLSSAVLAQCAGHDGGLSTDNFLNDPLACRFNPAKLLCTASNAGACLRQDKVNAIRKIFSGPPGIFPGYRLGAGEASNPVNWPEWLTDSGNPASATQAPGANSFFQNIVFPNSGWTPNSFTIEENAHQAEARTGAILDAVDPNLRPFKLQGGKLIQYAGWSDSAISPRNDVDYHKAVTEAMGGPEETREFYRLFMVPGMAHCTGGPGVNAFGGPNGLSGPNPADPADDVISALDNWVENGVAPEKIIATKYVNDDPTQGIAFQRPLCPFPKISKYNGAGSTTDAASFTCAHDR